MKTLNIAFYKFVDLNDIWQRRDLFKETAIALGIKGSILLSEEGINGFLAGPEEKIREFQTFLSGYPEFLDLPYKESWSENIPFTRMLVKVKKEIISMGVESVKPHHKTGSRILPQELKTWYDEKRDFVMIDTRNDYEVRLGTFEGAKDFNLKTFRQFPEKLKEIAAKIKDKPVVMFCTGGIRCEKATALAMDYGFENVYQLDGGILKYFEDTGGKHYNGDCFVFDYRVTVDPSLKPTPAQICYQCRAPLSKADQESPKYVYEKSCPYCVAEESQVVLGA